MSKRFVTSLAAGVAALASLAVSTAALAQVKVGVIAPITGPNAAFGAQLKNGAEQAAEDINAKGGINGQKIELVFGDDASQPAQGVSVANKFAGEGVKFVVGAFNSAVTMPSSEVFAENGILQITPASTNPQITERKLWNIFRTCGRDDQQGSVAAKYLLDKFKGKPIAIVHDKTTYGKGLADETKKALNAGGATEVMFEGIGVGEKDFSALVSKIKSANPAVVYFGGVFTEAGLIARQMREQGVTAMLMGGDGIAADEYAQVAGPAAEGTLMTFAPDPQKRPEAKAILAKFEARKFKPEAYTLYSYAALEIITQAAAAAKSLDPKAVSAEMKKGTAYKTVIGDIGYDAKGDITRPDYVMYTWKKGADGKITYVEQ
ncbi:MAG: branched-chain amino acid ABC transporter substrate-binding protein [Hyphomicrobiaceae bacterium]|nr:branched-chain amino acid ABC transporter substrate-binding protein [Hyphomicrobiaceae bacterium]